MSINVIALCMRVTSRQSTAALLLTRIIAWDKYASIKFGDHVWIAKSAAEWMEDTGTTLKQYKNAIHFLRTLGLVITESHLFKNKSCTFARLTDGMKKLIQDEKDQVRASEKGYGCELDVDHSDGPKKDHLYSTKETTIDNTIETTTLSPKALIIKKNFKAVSGEDQKEKIPKKKAMAMTHNTSDVVKGNLPPKKKTTAQTATAAAIHEWQERRGEVTGKFQGAFTIKMAATMKGFIQNAPPKADPVVIIRNVIKDWHSFGEEVKRLTGWKIPPAEPDFAWFIKYSEVAYNFVPVLGEQVPVIKGEKADPLAGFIKVKK